MHNGNSLQIDSEIFVGLPQIQFDSYKHKLNNISTTLLMIFKQASHIEYITFNTVIKKVSLFISGLLSIFDKYLITNYFFHNEFEITINNLSIKFTKNV